MQNWDRALELTTASQNSAGAATRMHNAAMEGLDATLNELTNSWQKLISSIANGDTFKGILKVATGLLKWLGNGNTLLKIFTTAIVLFNAKTLLTNVSLHSTGEEIKNVDKALIGLGKALGTTFTQLGSLTTAEMAHIGKLKEEQSVVQALVQWYIQLNKARKGDMTLALPAGNSDTGGSSGAGGTPSTNTGSGSGTKFSFKGMFKAGAKGAKNFAANFTKMVGSIQTGIMVASLAYSAIQWINGKIITTGDELYDQAQEEYEAKQEEIDELNTLVETVQTQAAVYDELSRKMNKSTEEVEQLAEAAEALAEAAPESIVGYDSNGNPIIDTTVAKGRADEAERELADAAKEQITNLGELSRAQIRQEAEAKAEKNSSADDWSKWSAVAGVIALAGATVATGGVAAVLAGIGAVAGGISIGNAIAYNSAMTQEEQALAQSEANKILAENRDAILQTQTYITKVALKDGIIGDTSSDDRFNLASRVGAEWMGTALDNAYQAASAEGWDSDRYQAELNKIGNNWEQILTNTLNDKVLAKGLKGLDDIAEGVGDKTYNGIEQAIDKVIQSDMGIDESNPLFKQLKEVFFDVAYEGLGVGVHDVVKELEDQMLADLEGVGDPERRKQIGNAYASTLARVKNMSNSDAAFYSDIGLLDNVYLFNDVISQYGQVIQEGLAYSTEAATVNTIAVLERFSDLADKKLKELAVEVGAEGGDPENIDYDTLTYEQKQAYDHWTAMAEDAANNISNAWNSLPTAVGKTWEQLWDEMEDITDRVKTGFETLNDLADGDGISIDQWKSFTLLFDDIDTSLFSTEQIAQYSQALDVLSHGLSMVNGKIFAQGEAIKSVTELEQLLAQAQIEQMRQELKNKKYTLEAEKAIIDAQIATMEYQLIADKTSVEGTEAKSKAEQAWLTASNKINTFFVSNQSKVVEAMVQSYSSGFQNIINKFSALQTAISTGTITQDQINTIYSDYQALQEKLTFKEYLDEIDEYGTKKLEAQLAAAKKISDSYGLSIKNIEAQLATLDLGIWVTEDGVGGKEDQKDAEVYIGQLKEIYNILNRIQILEHRLSTLNTYGEYAPGELAGDYWQQQLNYTKELIDQYSFLTKEQKQFTNGYKDFILSTEGLEGVFSFDQYGQIIINWEKYIALQNVAIDGETTLREKADDLYETYTEMFEDLQGYQDSAIDYYTQMIDKQQEAIDAYVETEKKAAEIIEEIYQKILDTKLEAIDKEIEALEDLQEAREKAREDEANAREVSGLQTDLQRAMMDTSGASDSAQIQARQELNDKLDEIADDKYSEMLNNMTQQLEDQKEMLQEEFDEMFENLDWLYSLIETEFMNNEQALQDLWEQQETWGKQTKIEREEEKNDLATKISTYNQAIQGTEGEGGTIYDLYNEMINNKAAIATLDENLKTEIANASSQIATTIANWKTSASSGGNTSGHTIQSHGGGDTEIKGEENLLSDAQSNYEPTSHPDYTGSIKAGMTLELDREPIYFYEKYDELDDPVRTTFSDARGYDRNVQVLEGPTWSDYWSKWMIKVFVKDINDNLAFWMPASADQHGTGSDKYFHQAGLFQSGTKYAQGGFADFTGPAWLDGTPSRPEAVLNALQTQHFIKFTDTLDKMFTTPGQGSSMGSSIVIDSISFNVDSMSSTEDGEKAFNAFVEKFKEIGSQKGIQINSFKKTI